MRRVPHDRVLQVLSSGQGAQHVLSKSCLWGSTYERASVLDRYALIYRSPGLGFRLALRAFDSASAHAATTFIWGAVDCITAPHCPHLQRRAILCLDQLPPAAPQYLTGLTRRLRKSSPLTSHKLLILPPTNFSTN